MLTRILMCVPFLLLGIADRSFAVQVPTQSAVERRAHPRETANLPEWEPGSAQPELEAIASEPIRKLPLGFSAEWISGGDAALVTTSAETTLPLLFVDTPPPLVKLAVTHTHIGSATTFDLPDDLYAYSVGASWFRKINDRWTVRTILGVELATDNRNTSGEAWRFQGGVLGICQANEQLSWTVGAIATGRSDLPVVPAVGAVWRPDSRLRLDLIYPRPRINYLLSDSGTRQLWTYLGAGISGSTWAYETRDGVRDQLTYDDMRVVLGWESRPSSSGGLPFARGKTIQAEMGYVFSREFEFGNNGDRQSLGDSFMIGVSTRF